MRARWLNTDAVTAAATNLMIHLRSSVVERLTRKGEWHEINLQNHNGRKNQSIEFPAVGTALSGHDVFEHDVDNHFLCNRRSLVLVRGVGDSSFVDGVWLSRHGFLIPSGKHHRDISR